MKTRIKKRNFLWVVSVVLGIVALWLVDVLDFDLNWIPIGVYLLAIIAWIWGIYYTLHKEKDK